MGDAFGVLSCPFCSTILKCGARLSINTINYWTFTVSGASFLAGRVFEGDLAHRRSVEELCMLSKIRRNPMHPLNGALPGLYVPVRVTRGAVIAYRYTYAPPRCRTSQYRSTIIALSVSLWNNLGHRVFDGVGLEGFKSRANDFYWPSYTRSLLFSDCFPFLFFHSMGWYRGAGAGVFRLKGR